jgi:hypothetical protein
MSHSTVEVSEVAATALRYERMVIDAVPGPPVVRSAVGTRSSSPDVPPAVLRVVVSGGGATWTIDALAVDTGKLAGDAVTNAKLANMATATFKGRVTAGTGDPEDLTGTEATSLLNVFASVPPLKGLVPASPGGTTSFLRADGSWAIPPGTATSANSIAFDVDFGATTDTTATATVAAAWVAAGTEIVIRPQGDTADHTAEDALIEEVQAVATNLVAGVGFDVIAYSPLGSTGQYRFAAVGV